MSDESITAEGDGSRLDSDLVILDGLGYLPFSLRRSLLFRLLSKLCERAPASSSTNLSLGGWASGRCHANVSAHPVVG
jgi:DNA replication protein DnaC